MKKTHYYDETSLVLSCDNENKKRSQTHSLSNYRECSTVERSYSTSCRKNETKSETKKYCPKQIFLLAYQLENITLSGDTIIPFLDSGTSTYPHHINDGVFTIPKNGDGIYNINVSLNFSEGLLEGAEVKLVITDDTSILESVVTYRTVSVIDRSAQISINLQLREGYTVKVIVTGTGEVSGGKDNYFNLARV